MEYEEKKLVCIDCEKDFVFSKEEQDFFNQKGFTEPPKRCKECRSARRKNGGKNRNRRTKGDGIYRSPAFENSAPKHQKIRSGHYRNDRSEYRAPASFGSTENTEDVYRSPAFRQYEQVKPEDEYRAPGFREFADIDASSEYRAPGFKEHEGVDPREEYRSPAFQNMKEKYRDERPLFSMVCPVCGKEAMVPFLPEEKENALCPDCFRASRDEKTYKQDESSNIDELSKVPKPSVEET